MTAPFFYMTSLAISTLSLFTLWHSGIRPLLLDNFRDALFTQRDRLYILGNSGKLEYDSDAYRAVELFLNSLIQYAYRFSFLSLLISYRSFDEEKAFTGSRAPSEILLRKVETVQDPNVRAELDSIVGTVTLELLPRYIAKSSVMFVLCTGVYLILAMFSPLAARLRELVVATFEAEAYRDNVAAVSPAF